MTTTRDTTTRPARRAIAGGLGVALAVGTLVATAAPARADAASDLAVAKGAVLTAATLAEQTESVTGATTLSAGGSGASLVVQQSSDGSILRLPGSILAKGGGATTIFLPLGSVARASSATFLLTPPAPLDRKQRKVLKRIGVKPTSLVVSSIPSTASFDQILTASSPYRLGRQLVAVATAGQVVDAVTTTLVVPAGALSSDPVEAAKKTGSVTVTIHADGQGRLTRVSDSTGGVEVAAYAAPGAVIPPASVLLSPRKNKRAFNAIASRSYGQSFADGVVAALRLSPKASTLASFGGKGFTYGKIQVRSFRLPGTLLVTAKGGGVTWTKSVKLKRGHAKVSRWAVALPRR
ncbi:MAG: hypothetical protein EPO13_11580 [Actinomycetota bacterium]|nr:MAG: hypothetical protein EPO13_11580 [Actinomycetota bacterium]